MAKTKSFGDWNVGQSLDEGGQAHAFLVSHSEHGECVLKRIKNPKRAWRNDREIEALLRLSTPHVPRILEMGEDERGRPWFVTAYRGDPLDHIAPTLSVREKLIVFSNVAMALCEAHAASIVHRDLKPSNVVVMRDARGVRASLIDFGICSLSELDQQTTVEAFGNPAFSAPECELGHVDRPGTSSDTYSAGKLLYWLLSDGLLIHRENLSRCGDGLASLPPVLLSRTMGVVHACVRPVALRRISATELLERTKDILLLAEQIEQETGQGILRLAEKLRCRPWRCDKDVTRHGSGDRRGFCDASRCNHCSFKSSVAARS